MREGQHQVSDQEIGGRGFSPISEGKNLIQKYELIRYPGRFIDTDTRAKTEVE
jgi:hypothetical protein